MTELSGTRIGGSKLKTGCITCKARHVKCDEARPTCSRCQRSGRACAGYSVVSKPAREPCSFIVYSARPAPCNNDRSTTIRDDQRALDYFQKRTALELGGPFSSDLWSVFVLRTAESEPAIKSAVVALAYIHEVVTLDHRQTNDCYNRAMRRYMRSMREVVRLTERPGQHASIIALVACILFAAIESLQGHVPSSISHLMSGMRILHECETEKQLKDNGPVSLDLLRPLFVATGIQIMVVSQAPWAGLSWLDQQASIRPPGSKFGSVEEAQDDLALLMKDLTRVNLRAKYVCNNTMYAKSELYGQLGKLKARLQSFTVAFDLLCSDAENRLAVADSREHKAAFASLRANHCTAKATIETVVETDQMCFDEYSAEFHEVVEQAETFLYLSTAIGEDVYNGMQRPTFSFPTGILNPLYVVCVRCRDPTIRHRALHLLKSCRRREGIFDSTLVARVAEEVVRLEESAALAYWKTHKRRYAEDKQDLHLADSQSRIPNEQGLTIVLRCAVDIPECCRLDRVDTVFPEDKKADMAFVSTNGDRQDRIVDWER